MIVLHKMQIPAYLPTVVASNKQLNKKKIIIFFKVSAYEEEIQRRTKKIQKKKKVKRKKKERKRKKKQKMKTKMKIVSP